MRPPRPSSSRRAFCCIIGVRTACSRIAFRLANFRDRFRSREIVVTDFVPEQCTVLLRALLRALETLEHAARHVRPDNLPDLAPLVTDAERELRAAVKTLSPWPDAYADMRGALDEAAESALRA